MTQVELRKLELHYYFDDKSHKIDANVRHKCETEFLNIINEVAKELKLEIKIDIEVPNEGGYIDFYNITTSNPEIVNTAISALSLLATTVGFIIGRRPIRSSTPELDAANLEIAKLTIENLKKEREVINKVNPITPFENAVNGEELDTESPPIRIVEKEESQQIVPIAKNDFIDPHLQTLIDNIPAYEYSKQLTRLQTSKKVNQSKSKFFDSANKYQKITRITTTPLNESNEQLAEPTVIDKGIFSQYIIELDETSEDTDDNATIEIVAAILSGKYKWKGFYNGKVIDFSMKSKEFKGMVDRYEISFKKGVAINCTLKIKRKTEEQNLIEKITYSVVEVGSFIEDGITKQIRKSITKRNNKKISNPSQLNLIDHLDNNEQQ